MTPAKRGREPGVISVGGDPLAARFDGEGGVSGVRHEGPADTGKRAEILKDCPMLS